MAAFPWVGGPLLDAASRKVPLLSTFLPTQVEMITDISGSSLDFRLQFCYKFVSGMFRTLLQLCYGMLHNGSDLGTIMSL